MNPLDLTGEEFVDDIARYASNSVKQMQDIFKDPATVKERES